MTKQQLKTEPTPFGTAARQIAVERGVVLEDQVMDPEHAAELQDHLDGIEPDNSFPGDFVRAVARALGLDYTDPADYEACTKLAYTSLYRKPYLDGRA